MAKRGIKTRVEHKVATAGNAKVNHGLKKKAKFKEGWLIRGDSHRTVVIPVWEKVHLVVNDWRIMQMARKEINA